MEFDGTEGVLFAVWAPNAIRVSVVGTFNKWDGRVYPMECREDSGIYELFIPGLEDGTLYKYEIKLADGLTYMRPDPYGNEFELRPANASVVSVSDYRWHDREYLKARKEQTFSETRPVAIYELSFQAFMDAEGNFRTLREITPEVVSHAKEFGYSHIELMPVMEYPDDSTSGYQTTGYFAPTSRFGRPDDYRFFIDSLHREGIGVILDWTPSQFSAAEEGLASFDGTCLYEHLDPRQGTHPIWGTKIWNYGRPQVRNLLISNALFWTKEFHADGLRMDGVSTILRLDYGRADGQWVANMYGTNENLDGIEFLKHLNSIMKKNHPDILLIAEEDVDWPDVTGEVDESHLGFDYKWNLHFTQDVLGYFAAAPEERKNRHNDLTESMLYNYIDRFIISLSRDIELFDPERLMASMPGEEEVKKANLRAAYAFMTAHPGKKLLTKGEEFDPVFFKALLKLYRENPALYEEDYLGSGFEWVNTLDSEHGVLSFLRKTDRPEETILVLCNFSAEEYAGYRTGVPYAGDYREIFNTDAKAYGGNGKVNARTRTAREKVCDERKNSITVRLAPFSVSFIKPRRSGGAEGGAK
jgi:1,4-alpha-glucan branching enzyme